MRSMKQGIAGFGKTLVPAAVAALLAFGPMAGTAQAGGCQASAGAWLVTVTDGNGNLASRQVLTLTHDHAAFVVDSNQGGVTGVFNPFTSEQGSWVCKSGSVTATVLDFSLPGSVSGPQQIARGDYAVTAATAQTISGTIDLRFYALTDNPLATPLPAPAASFTFTGSLIN
jgi:hypothetical protein